MICINATTEEESGVERIFPIIKFETLWDANRNAMLLRSFDEFIMCGHITWVKIS